MNAAIRAVVRTGLASGLTVWGVYDGYAGLLAANFKELRARDVGGIIQQGGTVLGTARCKHFETDENLNHAIAKLHAAGIEGLVVIGGNGSQQGAHALHKKGFPVVGVASTIDNDLYGSDMTIGVDTALNVAVHAIDSLKVTASSHHRALLIEVMGRKCGYLALMAGIAGGAEAIVLPEVDVAPELLAASIQETSKLGKPHAIIVVSEGARYNAEGLCRYFRDNDLLLGYEFRSTVLGHVQRGAPPTCADRLLGTRLGFEAVQQMIAGNLGVLVGTSGDHFVYTPLEQVVNGRKALDPWYLKAAEIMSH